VFFDKARCEVFGLCKSIGLYRFYECCEPKLEVAKDFIQRRGVVW